MLKFNLLVKDKRGTALIVSLMVMGVLIAISLALSALIFRETRLTKNLLDSGRAYYAAESAIEEALYFLDSELPGWDTGEENEFGKLSNKAVFEYEVKNKCNSYPCFDEDEFNLASIPLHKFYDVLELNENITIPLFTVNEQGDIVAVKDFTVEFYTRFDPAQDLNLKYTDGSAIAGWDVLRWKVFGLNKTENGLLTESIHDFTAVSSGQNINDGQEFSTNAEKPSWFGSLDCDSVGSDLRQTDDIQCIGYASTAYFDASEEQNVGTCQHNEARDYYYYENGEFQQKIPCYPILEFMQKYQPVAGSEFGPTGLNYLSLTNLMNPTMLSNESYPTQQDKTNASRIFYRVETYDKDTVREFATIIADGYSGDAKQSIKVRIKRDSYMPVFNFSLYSTYKDENESAFYVEENDPLKDFQLPE